MLLQKDFDELIASNAQPALSLYLPTHLAGREIRQDGIRLKNLITQAAAQLRTDWRQGEVASFLAPAISLVDDRDFWRGRENGLAVFLAPDITHIHKLPVPVPEEAMLGAHFHIRPLLPILDDAGPFRLLAISARHSRLYEGSRWSFTEVDDIDLPQGVETIAGATHYEETYAAAPTGRRSSGLANAQSLGDSPEAVRKGELIELLNRMATAINPHITGSRTPLVFASQPETQGHLRAIAPWRELLPEGIVKNPDGMTVDELRRRAYAIVAGASATAHAAALDRLRGLAGAGSEQMAARPDDIVKAAHSRRIDTLFLDGERHLWGTFDEAQDRVVAHGRPVADDVDLFDYAALMTLRYGGRVVLVERLELPAPAAAILRY
jgi:Bacterial archaeo-eukaryotic release factor family 3